LMPYMHEDLVELGRKWLMKPWRNASIGGHGACSIILTEIATYCQEIPDVIGWCGSKSVLIECKTTFEDFKADVRKDFRRSPENGIGDVRYYLAPQGVIPVEDVLDGWGLLQVNEKGKISCQRVSKFFEANHYQEKQILLSVLRRLSIIPDKCVSLRVYKMSTRNRASLTIEDPGGIEG